MKIKRILALIAAGALLCSAYVFGEAIRIDPSKQRYVDKSAYKLYEDFSSSASGEKPNSLGTFVEAANTSAAIVRAENEDGINKKMLKITDNNENGNINFRIPINQASPKTLLEVKFKYVKTSDDYCSFGFSGYNGSSMALRVIQWSQGGAMAVYSSAGTNVNFTGAAPKSGEWYTLQIQMDSAAQSFDTQIQSNALKGLSTPQGAKFDKVNGASMVKGVEYYTEFSGGNISDIVFETTSRRGEFYFDYIAVKENAGTLEFKGQKPAKLPLPMTAAPVSAPVDGRINVSYNGEYMFFTHKPFEENGCVYVPLKSLASYYGFGIKAEAGRCVLVNTSGETVIVTADTAQLTIGSAAASMEQKTLLRNGVYYVPVVAFAQAMGSIVQTDENGVIRIEHAAR